MKKNVFCIPGIYILYLPLRVVIYFKIITNLLINLCVQRRYRLPEEMIISES